MTNKLSGAGLTTTLAVGDILNVLAAAGVELLGLHGDSFAAVVAHGRSGSVGVKHLQPLNAGEHAGDVGGGELGAAGILCLLRRCTVKLSLHSFKAASLNGSSD